jgi:hypothetical protein
MAGSMCFRARKKNGWKGRGLVAEAYQRWKNKDISDDDRG